MASLIAVHNRLSCQGYSVIQHKLINCLQHEIYL